MSKNVTAELEREIWNRADELERFQAWGEKKKSCEGAISKNKKIKKLDNLI